MPKWIAMVIFYVRFTTLSFPMPSVQHVVSFIINKSVYDIGHVWLLFLKWHAHKVLPTLVTV
jgi:hypothetical protein